MSLSNFIYPLALSSLIFTLLHVPSCAQKQTYIVYMGNPAPHDGGGSSLFGDEKMATTQNDLLNQLSTGNGRPEMVYSYTKTMNGFAAKLDENEINELKNNPSVKAVFPNTKYDLHTTRSWEFLGLDAKPTSNSVWERAKFGEDVIVACLDTGVWPESESFNDVGMGPVPARWKGSCADGVRCNKKLIGAKFFCKGALLDSNGTMDCQIQNARDYEGHGTHTLSTVGGDLVPGASIFGYGNGTAKGGSPKARVASYKVCWETGCFAADILKAFDEAIKDGVDVLSVSLGGDPVNLYQDGTAIGAYYAIKRGIPVIASAGNNGPAPGTVTNIAPWFITVGASTMDREFTSVVTLGNKKTYSGASLSDKSLRAGQVYPLIDAASAGNKKADKAALCNEGSLDPVKVKGKIVVCLRGESGRLVKGSEVANAGGVGMILVNDQDSGNGILADPHFLPASHVSYTDGQAIYAYIKSTPNPVGSLSPVNTVIGGKPAPAMASFSSRGPNVLFPGLLKPDITAPGVDVLAAFTQAVSPTEMETDKRRIRYDIMSGTSMSCPHVSGIVGLIKSVHPDWSPAAIKSAIMTTSKTIASDNNPIKDSDGTVATPFAMGAGHVQPVLAIDPGLVYDLTPEDYLNSLCAIGYNETVIKSFTSFPFECPQNFTLNDFNYPSISVPDLTTTVTLVTRRVKNVGPPGTYNVRVVAPAGVSISVLPTQLAFTKPNEEKEFKVAIKALANGQPKDFAFGHFEWFDGKHVVRSPVVAKHR